MALQPRQIPQQRLLLAPNMTLALEVLRMTTLELQTFLHQQLDENLMLELEEPSDDEALEPELANDQAEAPSAGLDEEWLSHWRTGGADETQDAEEERSLEERLTKPQSLHDSLRLQLGCQPLSPEDRRLGEAILIRLNEHGYLEGSLEELAAETGAAVARLEQLLKVIQRFDPPGVGARDVRECLLIQLEQRGEAESLAARLLRDHFPLFLQRRLDALASAARVSREAVEEACEGITRLDPKPGRLFLDDLPPSVIPDLIIVKRERHDDVELNDQDLPRVHINRAYHRMLRYPTTPEEAKAFLIKKFRQARWVIRAIDERNATLLAIGRCIISLQRDFVEQGPQALKPMTQAQVASLIGRHSSTVSRAIAGKTMDTPSGIFRLEQLFASGVPQRPTESTSPSDGAPSASAVSDAQIKAEIQRLVAEEDVRRPLSDAALAKRLGERQIAVARRTIAKYRASIRIPPAHLRRRF